jgi:SNF2 family DNA or RNA helicase
MNYLIQPWRHQLEAIDRAKNLPGFALFFEMGAGKTSTAINILRHRFNAARSVLRTLILCPPIVVKNWRSEWLAHSKLDPSRVVLLTGSGKQRLKLFRANADKPGGAIFVTNYESLLMSDLYEAFLQWGPEALIFDESHKLKSPTAKRSKLAEKLANPRGREKPLCYILSGSPILNTPMDIFQQFLILDGGKTFGANYFGFRARYFRDRNAGMSRDKYFPDWRIMTLEREGFDALSEINQKIYTMGMRVEKKDCMDLPPLVREKILVEMTPHQRKLYEEMKQDFLTFMNDQAIVATLAITKALRLMQIASGYVKTAEGNEISLENTPKMEALRELLEELTPNHKVLVWAVWRENYAQIRQVCNDLGIKYVEVHGDITSEKKFAAVDQFNSDPETRVFIGHPGSGGIGITLVPASYSIFYSRNFSLEQDLQAEARNHRGGSEIHPCITRIDLICEGTIDELVTSKLAEKVSIGEKILKDLSREL